MKIFDHNQLGLFLRLGQDERRRGVEKLEAQGQGINRGLHHWSSERLEITTRLPDDLDPGPECRSTALLPAATEEHTAPSLRGSRSQLLHKPRFADACL